MNGLLKLLQEEETYVSFAPCGLAGGDRWRFVLRRLFPRSGDPIRTALVRTIMVAASAAVIGFALAALTDRLPPFGLIILLGAVLTFLPLVRLVRVWCSLLDPSGCGDLYALGIYPWALTVSTNGRFLMIFWPEITGIRVTRHEVVFTMVGRDVASAPLSAFEQDRHLYWFVTKAEERITRARDGKTT